MVIFILFLLKQMYLCSTKKNRPIVSHVSRVSFVEVPSITQIFDLRGQTNNCLQVANFHGLAALH